MSGDAFADGLALRERHRWKAAVGAFERVTLAEPERAEAWFWLAVTLDRRGEEARAVPAYRRARALGLDAVKDVQAATWLASSLSKTGADALAALAEAEAAGGYQPSMISSA